MSDIDFKIGSDAEFAIVNESGYINEGENIARGWKTGRSSNGSLGSDGGGLLLEVRPAPTECPIESVNNMRSILQNYLTKNNTNKKFLQKFSARTMIGNSSLGGHIHFGFHNTLRRKAGFSKYNYLDLTYHLSTYLGSVCFLLDDKEGSLNRLRKGYGGFDDYREQPWGMEYRTPSTWLGDPYIALGVNCLAKVVAHHGVNNWRDVKEVNRYSLGYKLAHMYENKESTVHKTIENAMPTVINEISKMSLYKKYKSQINPLFQLIENGRSWTPTNDNMKETWGLSI